MPSFRDLVVRAINENDIRYIKMPVQLLNDTEQEIFNYITKFYRNANVVPTQESFLKEFSNTLNKSYFEQINDRYDLKTLVEVVVQERVAEHRKLYAQQHFDEGLITYQEFSDAIKRLDKISNSTKSSIITAEQMSDDFDWLLTGFVETPLRDLNRIMSGGMGYGDLSLFAGGTGMGKSYLISFIILHALISGKRVVINPSEMGKNGYWMRFISWATGVSWDKFLTALRSKDNTVQSIALDNYKKAHKELKGYFGDKLIFTQNNYGSVRDFAKVVDEVYDNYGEMALFVTDTIQDVETAKSNNKFTQNDNAAQTSKELRNWVTEYNEPAVGKFFHYFSSAQYIKSQQNPVQPTKEDIGGSKRNVEDATYVFGLTTQGESVRRGIPIKVRHGAGKGHFSYQILWDTMGFEEILSTEIEGNKYQVSDIFNIKLRSWN